MEKNDTGELPAPRISLRERLGHWLIGSKPEPPPSLSQLQADFAQLRLEWADTLDFIQRWAGRQAKRDQKAIKENLNHPADSVGTDHAPVPTLDKSELRRRAAALRTANGGHHPFGRAEP